jgi:RNA polymerase sigma-70 factor (ECF subfamily)
VKTGTAWPSRRPTRLVGLANPFRRSHAKAILHGCEHSFNTTKRFGVLLSVNDQLKDGRLVRMARAGDGAAFGTLVARYMRAAYAVAYSVTGGHEDAEDAAQEAFLVALDRLEECRSPDKFAGWLMTIVRNRSRNLVRRETLRSTDPVPVSARSKTATPDRVTERAELRRQLDAALGKLSTVQREIVLLHDLEGWKHREIADRLDIPSGTVRSHLHFARKALRLALAGESSRVMERA